MQDVYSMERSNASLNELNSYEYVNLWGLYEFWLQNSICLFYLSWILGVVQRVDLLIKWQIFIKLFNDDFMKTCTSVAAEIAEYYQSQNSLERKHFILWVMQHWPGHSGVLTGNHEKILSKTWGLRLVYISTLYF